MRKRRGGESEALMESVCLYKCAPLAEDKTDGHVICYLKKTWNTRAPSTRINELLSIHISVFQAAAALGQAGHCALF